MCFFAVDAGAHHVVEGLFNWAGLQGSWSSSVSLSHSQSCDTQPSIWVSMLN